MEIHIKPEDIMYNLPDILTVDAFILKEVAMVIYHGGYNQSITVRKQPKATYRLENRLKEDLYILLAKRMLGDPVLCNVIE